MPAVRTRWPNRSWTLRSAMRRGWVSSGPRRRACSARLTQPRARHREQRRRGRSSAREGQTFEGRAALVRYANLVKLPHTLFALPFAMVGVVLASYVKDVTFWMILWVAVAFTSARFAAMGFNRVVDRRIDALNPRTSRREIPAGVIGSRQAGVAVAVASALFLVAAWRLNPLCLVLAPLALAWILGYSYTK